MNREKAIFKLSNHPQKEGESPHTYACLQHGLKAVYQVNEKEVIKQPGDGHCIIHSMRASLSMSPIAAICFIQMLRFKIMNDLGYHKEFVNKVDQENADIEADVNRCIHEKAYGNDTMDLIIYALANCLCVALQIFERSGQHYTPYTVPIAPARRAEPPRAVLDILRTPEHCDALVDVRNSDTGLLHMNLVFGNFINQFFSDQTAFCIKLCCIISLLLHSYLLQETT